MESEEKIKARNKEYYREHREKISKQARDYYKNNRNLYNIQIITILLQ